MAVQFHPLPLEIFEPKTRRFIARLNGELRDLFALEGVIRNPLSKSRSDSSIVRRDEVQVDVTRITPSITTVIQGSSTVVGAPNLTFSTVNLVGTTTTAIATDSTVAVFGTSTPVALGTAATGSQGKAARIDHVHPLTEALGTAADRTKTLTLADSADGAILTSSATWTANYLNLKAPGATDALNIGKYGNITLAGQVPSDTKMLQFAKLDFNEATTRPLGINFTVTNTNIGDGTALVQGLNAAVSGSCTNAAALTTRNIIGSKISVAGGGSANNYFQGSIYIYDAAASAQAKIPGTAAPITEMVGYRAFSTAGLINCAVTDLHHFKSHGNVTVALGSLTNHTGYHCDAITAGTNRYGMNIASFTTGAATVAYGVNVGLHSVGTTRRSFRGGNSFECTNNNFIAGYTGMGLVVKDANDGNYYLIGTSAGVIGVSSLGATLPAI